MKKKMKPKKKVKQVKPKLKKKVKLPLLKFKPKLMSKKPKREHLQVINSKVSKVDRQKLTESAKKFTKGNISAWIRLASLRYVPSKSEIKMMNLVK